MFNIKVRTSVLSDAKEAAKEAASKLVKEGNVKLAMICLHLPHNSLSNSSISDLSGISTVLITNHSSFFLLQ